MSHFSLYIWYSLFTVFTYFDRAFTARNVNRYRRSPLKEAFAAAAASVRAEVYNPSYTMIGDNIEVLRKSFTASKEAGKTWQIWAGATSKYIVRCLLLTM